MCGRFSLAVDPKFMQMEFPWMQNPEDISPRYNIAPSQPIAVVPNDGTHKLSEYRWGLIPHWASDAKIGNRMINARSETLREKVSFKHAFIYRRCLIPADGFFEWTKLPGRKSKQPVYFKLKNNRPFMFAGLWESWQSETGDMIKSTAIITTEPNDLVREIHTRMPVILDPDHYHDWLTPGEADIDYLQNFLIPYPSNEMEYYPVSMMVNSPKNDLPICVQPETGLL